MRLVKGKDLTSKQCDIVLRAFVYRLTQENGNKVGATMPKAEWPTDERWILEHAFYINDDGMLSNKPRRCEPHYLAEDPVLMQDIKNGVNLD